MTREQTARMYLTTEEYNRFIFNVHTFNQSYMVASMLSQDVTRGNFLSAAFTWDHTTQGHDYWAEIDDEVSQKTDRQFFKGPIHNIIKHSFI